MSYQAMTFHPLKALWPPLLIAITGAVLGATISPFFVVVFVFGFFDLRGRARDYNYLLSCDYIPPRLALYYGRSYCGRNLVCSFHPYWRNFYHTFGYRWWHFLPDDIHKVVWKRNFWLCLFSGHTIGAVK